MTKTESMLDDEDRICLCREKTVVTSDLKYRFCTHRGIGAVDGAAETRAELLTVDFQRLVEIRISSKLAAARRGLSGVRISNTTERAIGEDCFREGLAEDLR